MSDITDRRARPHARLTGSRALVDRQRRVLAGRTYGRRDPPQAPPAAGLPGTP